MIGVCGLVCSDCPALQATLAADGVRAAEIASEWSRAYHVKVTTDDVWCYGCHSDGRKCAHCAECAIRACGVHKGHDTCAQCDDYPCAPLTGFHTMVPQARHTLDSLR